MACRPPCLPKIKKVAVEVSDFYYIETLRPAFVGIHAMAMMVEVDRRAYTHVHP